MQFKTNDVSLPPMKTIGNIVGAKPIDCNIGIITQCDTITDIQSLSLPTLIVGFENARNIIPDFNILDKHPYKNLWWTYRKNENRYEHETDIVSFTELCINNLLENIEYKYIDLINFNWCRTRKMLKYLSNKKKEKVVHYTRGHNFMFIYVPLDKTVYGISLTLCEYLGYDREKVMVLARKLPNLSLVNDYSFISGKIGEIANDSQHLVSVMFDIWRRK